MIKKALISIGLVVLTVLLSGYVYLNPYNRPASTESTQISVPKREKLRTSQRGVYLTGNSALDREFLEYIVRNSKLAGLDSVVIEIKSLICGNIRDAMLNHKLFDYQIEAASPSLKRIVDYLHSEGMIVSGRMVIFKDDYLALRRQDLAIKDESGNLWRDRGGAYWVDPYSKEVWEYNILVAELAAWSGIDEIQYDYVRFPTEGSVGKIIYPHKKQGVSHPQNIAAFLTASKDRLRKYNVALTADIFGVVAWQCRTDIEDLGQDLKLMQEPLDAICPMLYPSHFAPGFDGYKFPGDEPYYFIKRGVDQLKVSLTPTVEGEKITCEITPWIQGFAWGTNIFGPEYVRQQIKAVNDAGFDRYLVWNANNAYTPTFLALTQKSDKTTLEATRQ
ncbi:MAG: putative glycoside hydrolase [Candidatus Margulisbacteria bacterium]|nr:putative glycoside hydrolase [Candidatus Margulisiibacteriota bacterium]MBU1022326.1 putative glycoside hydrolase [Candidatus Margulisiibacteriota bacterium]MBU1729576.1 putative glycoside hydrolase [Candidatus Margulisiibacteriota bacterium]MBU1955062.1 putative glycoside hydrolase [Candidatus Margulisiibacteriota bacterium]